METERAHGLREPLVGRAGWRPSRVQVADPDGYRVELYAF
jgi:hypothetical protein